MSSPETFVSELEGKNQTSFERLIQQWLGLISEQDLSVVALCKLEARFSLESTEVAALWTADTEGVTYKMALARSCGACAERYNLIANRLEALGVTEADFDPVALGYSRLFGFFRSLQTVEERAAAGPLTAGSFALERYRIAAERARQTGDLETATLFSETLPATETEAIHSSRVALLGRVKNEEAQARARRASFRSIELLTELHESGLVKKFLSRSSRRAAAT